MIETSVISPVVYNLSFFAFFIASCSATKVALESACANWPLRFFRRVHP